MELFFFLFHPQREKRKKNPPAYQGTTDHRPPALGAGVRIPSSRGHYTLVVVVVVVVVAVVAEVEVEGTVTYS